MPRKPSSRKPSWNVEDALEEVIDAVKKGAQPLEVDEETVQGLKVRYRPDFEKQFQESDHWLDLRDRVLDLAERVGDRAMALTVGRWLNPSRDESAPKSVDAVLTYTAAYLVAKTCKPTGTTRGRYCCSMYISEEDKELENKIDSIFPNH